MLYLTKEIETQTTYFIPKTHKDPIKLRPIVSCTGGPTTTVSAFLDRLLQRHIKATRTYLRNLTELVRNLQNLESPRMLIW